MDILDEDKRNIVKNLKKNDNCGEKNKVNTIKDYYVNNLLQKNMKPLNIEGHTTSYPPYDVIQSEDQYRDIVKIELAVAGFKISDLKISVKNYTLNIMGYSIPKDTDNEYSNNGVYLHRGIARRSFTKNFSLSSDMRIFKTTLKRGILSILIIADKPHVDTKEIEIIEEY